MSSPFDVCTYDWVLYVGTADEHECLAIMAGCPVPRRNDEVHTKSHGFLKVDRVVWGVHERQPLRVDVFASKIKD